jgi:hypothetical protein
VSELRRRSCERTRVLEHTEKYLFLYLTEFLKTNPLTRHPQKKINPNVREFSGNSDLRIFHLNPQLLIKIATIRPIDPKNTPKKPMLFLPA